RRHRPRSPHANAAAVAAKIPGAVHAARVEHILVAFGHRKFQIDRAANYFIGRRLVNATLNVGACVDARDMSGGGNQASVVDGWVKDPDPGIVESSIRAVARRLDRSDVALPLELGNNREAIL